MKRLLLPLLAALALPTAINANIEDQFFPNLEIRPRDFSEWYHLGVITGHGGSLCVQFLAGHLTLETSIAYRDGMITTYAKEGERAKKFTIDGFNEGILTMQNMDNSPFSVKELKKCDKLKIK